MSQKSMEPYGLALKDFYNGNKNVKIVFHRDDGLREEAPIIFYFRNQNNFTSLEKLANKLCQGRVLDIGAGVGPHSLSLQNRGLDVLAIDISPHACEIMKNRGVQNVMCLTIYDLKKVKFDTIILMGRSIGFVENLSGLKKFLNYCKDLLNPEGIILLDSIDVQKTTNQIHLAYHKKNLELGRYFGEIRIQIEYKGQLGERIQILHVDPRTLMASANGVGWSCEILLKEKNGAYLAKIF